MCVERSTVDVAEVACRSGKWVVHRKLPHRAAAAGPPQQRRRSAAAAGDRRLAAADGHRTQDTGHGKGQGAEGQRRVTGHTTHHTD